MNKFFAIVPVKEDPFLITWDLGRRCNFDCSYCPSHRHDNFSPHASLDELKSTTDFLFEYCATIAEHRINKDFHVSFTGGEPTVNPKFIEFAKHIRSVYEEKWKDKFNLHLSLTTNGAMSSAMSKAIIENFDFVTVSYHSEIKPSIRQQICDRLIQFKDAGMNLKVNVMFHADNFEDCKNLCYWLKIVKINFIPRLIGDDPDSKSSQAHLYTDDQKQWLKDYWNINITPTSRPCCGGRTMGLCTSEGTVESKAVEFREFKGWSCSVNWYFLHIEQQTKQVFTHQTCQARLDGTRGPIGTLDAWSAIVDDLKVNLAQKTMPIITCPNNLCGCGLCTPKSENRQDLLKTLPAVVKDISIFS